MPKKFTFVFEGYYKDPNPSPPPVDINGEKYIKHSSTLYIADLKGINGIPNNTDIYTTVELTKIPTDSYVILSNIENRSLSDAPNTLIERISTGAFPNWNSLPEWVVIGFILKNELGNFNKIHLVIFNLLVENKTSLVVDKIWWTYRFGGTLTAADHILNLFLKQNKSLCDKSGKVIYYGNAKTQNDTLEVMRQNNIDTTGPDYGISGPYAKLNFELHF